MLRRLDRADALIPVVYTDDHFAARRVIPRRELISALADRIQNAGFIIHDALCVAADGWGSYLDPLLPVSGHPLEGIGGSPDEGGDRGHRIGRNSMDKGALSAPSTLHPIRRAEIRSALDEIRRAGNDPSCEVEQLLTEAPALIPPVQMAHLIASAQHPTWRDHALLQLAFGSLHERERAHAPMVRRVRTAIELLQFADACAQTAQRPNLLLMLAWLNWSIGSSSAATAYAGRALEIDPDHRVTALLRTALHAGVVPEWSFTNARAGPSAGGQISDR